MVNKTHNATAAVSKPRASNQERVRALISSEISRMVKSRPATTSRGSTSTKTRASSNSGQQSNTTFGPVSTIDTAPVSIGNTIMGCSPIVVPTKDGVRVKGRDFLCNVDIINNAAQVWTLAGGAPITPSCMSSSALKQYSNVYAEYKVHAVAFHFITATTTSTPGSIMLYVGKDRAGPGVITSSSSLMPFVLSDHCTVITPVWQNASSMYEPAPKWYTTGLGNDEGLHEQACGELFVLDKSNSTNPPGYILMDYDISFRTMQVNIKSLIFPISRMKYTQISLEYSSATTANTALPTMSLAGVLLDGSSSSVVPTGTQVGDVFKCIFNAAQSSWNGIFTSSRWLSVSLGDSNFLPLSTVTDGYTCYGVWETLSVMRLYPTYEAAITLASPLLAQETHGGYLSQTYWYISYVGSVGNSTLQASY